jgi:hypothetical protein
VAIDDIKIVERPDDLEPVTRPEAKGMWTSIDQQRIAMQSAANDITDIKHALGAISTEQKWQRRVMLVPCAIAVAVLMLVVVRQLDDLVTRPPAAMSALIAMVSR